MFRHIGTNASGRPFDPATIQTVWDKAAASKERPLLKIDRFGRLMWRGAYGNTSSMLGWEINHIKPLADGGGDDLENLQALQWQNNRANDKTDKMDAFAR